VTRSTAREELCKSFQLPDGESTAAELRKEGLSLGVIADVRGGRGGLRLEDQGSIAELESVLWAILKMLCGIVDVALMSGRFPLGLGRLDRGRGTAFFQETLLLLTQLLFFSETLLKGGLLDLSCTQFVEDGDARVVVSHHIVLAHFGAFERWQAAHFNAAGD